MHRCTIKGERGVFSKSSTPPKMSCLCLDLVRQETCDSSDFTLAKRELIGTAQFLCKYFSQKKKKFHYRNSYRRKTVDSTLIPFVKNGQKWSN